MKFREFLVGISGQCSSNLLFQCLITILKVSGNTFFWKLLMIFVIWYPDDYVI